MEQIVVKVVGLKNNSMAAQTSQYLLPGHTSPIANLSPLRVISQARQFWELALLSQDPVKLVCFLLLIRVIPVKVRQSSALEHHRVDPVSLERTKVKGQNAKQHSLRGQNMLLLISGAKLSVNLETVQKITVR